ncbi:uncharacterized protein LOC130998042 [Salvia miltiorrhiza]|uniref:uncharacterized protein LOC130998042 n=1 Tax=Salvia miltiorrhiza TaxID=226208 RepID=UPI0025AD7CD0|nr:uncharacterized protein LOC130998042 [Salvia miltiorrhiza]
MVHLKDLQDDQKMAVVHFLLQNSKDGKPAYGKMKEAGTKFNLGRRTVTRLWAEAKKQKQQGQVINLNTKRRFTPRITKRIQIDVAQIQALELCRRGTIRRLARGIQISKSIVGRWVHLGLIRAHTSALKPDLTAPNKLLRLRFSLQAIEYDRIANVLKFKTMHNVVHVDEKWFYMTKDSHRFYLTQEEIEPHRSCKSKNHIIKVMFMCAVCRPIFDDDGNCIFDGKIGILNKVFLSLQGCMIETMKIKGHNAYKLPHMKKDALIRQNALPITLEVDKNLVDECINHMIQSGEEATMQDLKAQLGYEDQLQGTTI